MDGRIPLGATSNILVGKDVNGLLNACPNRFTLRILRPFIHLNNLDAGKLIELNNMLTEARENRPVVRGGRFAWEALATFALYTYSQVIDLADIAEHLYLAQPTVKRWITAIYQAFDLDQERFPDRAARRRELRLRAQEAGYIKETSWLRRSPEGLDTYLI